MILGNSASQFQIYKHCFIPFVYSEELDCYEKSVMDMNKSMPTTQAEGPTTQAVTLQGRPKKKPDYDADAILSALIDAVADSYLSPSEDEEVDGHKPIKLVAEEFKITPLKVRKLLITGGAYRTPISERVQDLHREGKTIAQIQEATGLSRASVHSYLPYVKGVYKASELSTDAERIKLYRNRKNSLGGLKNREINLWIIVELFAGYPFTTTEGCKFDYSVRGNEMHVNREMLVITRATVDAAYQRVLELSSRGANITGGKQINNSVASYLFPMFVRFGIVKKMAVRIGTGAGNSGTPAKLARQ